MSSADANRSGRSGEPPSVLLGRVLAYTDSPSSGLTQLHACRRRAATAAWVAQSVEQRTRNAQVRSSNLLSGSSSEAGHGWIVDRPSWSLWGREFTDADGGPAGLPGQLSSSSTSSVASRVPAVLPLLSATPTHPQILTCYEEATQFTGTVPPIGPHDIGFGPGYFPQARRLATMNPPNSGRGAQLTGYKLPPVAYPGAKVTMMIARGTRSYVVQQNPWSPRQGSESVTYRACLHKRGFFPQSFRFTDGRQRGYVPLDVRVDGQRKTNRIVLSFFAGPYRTSP